MRSSWILLLGMCLVGCATQRQAVRAPAVSTPPSPVVRESAPTRLVETRYEVRGYREADNPSVRHEPHAVYRATRVPARVESLDVAPRSSFEPASHSPLPQSAELSAELAAQRQITTELREIKARMAAIEQQAQSQYGALVDQTASTLQLRQQLESERARVRELEARLRDKTATSGVTEGGARTAVAEVKW